VAVQQPSAVQLATANPDRVKLIIRNDGPATLWIGDRDVTPGGQSARRLAVDADFEATTSAGWYGAVYPGANTTLAHMTEESG
jgi:hypothetical protein